MGSVPYLSAAPALSGGIRGGYAAPGVIDAKGEAICVCCLCANRRGSDNEAPKQAVGGAVWVGDG